GIRDKLVTGVQTCALPISYLVARARRELAHLGAPAEADHAGARTDAGGLDPERMQQAERATAPGGGHGHRWTGTIGARALSRLGVGDIEGRSKRAAGCDPTGEVIRITR